MQTCYNLVHLSKSNEKSREVIQRHLENASLELDDYLGKLPITFLHHSTKHGMKNIEDKVFAKIVSKDIGRNPKKEKLLS